ncbi:MAG: restriction endonuclease subunit S [Candidatus Campbellbacteria bacterium]|nr:restriction endonuclease subunit S [Candidatus Campbellbacteria bacterium]
MKFKDLFHIDYGQKEYHDKSNLTDGDGDKILISSKGEDGGIYGFFDIPRDGYKAPIITVPSTGTIGQAFLQLRDCSVDDNCLVLIPKDKNMSEEEMYQVIYQIRKLKWRFKYGRQITPERLGNEKLKIIDTNIDKKKLENQLSLKKPKNIKVIDPKKFVHFRVDQICLVEKKKALPKNAINLTGNIPYVTTSSKNNGVKDFTDEESNFPKNRLTVSLNGSVGEVFFQTKDFITSTDNVVLSLLEEKFKGDIKLLLFVGFMIKRYTWGFSWSRKLSKKKLEKLIINLPVNDKNELDLKYIHSIADNSLGITELKEYIK